jgi:hypothetical protein
MEEENQDKPDVQVLRSGDIPILNNDADNHRKNNEPKKEICPHCHQEYVPPKRGFGNWKNLFRKPTLSEWTILFMMIGLLISAYAYNTETKSCREFMKNLEFNCMQVTAIANHNNTVADPLHIQFTPSISDNLGGEINQSHAEEQNQTNQTNQS